MSAAPMSDNAAEQLHKVRPVHVLTPEAIVFMQRRQIITPLPSRGVGYVAASQPGATCKHTIVGRVPESQG